MIRGVVRRFWRRMIRESWSPLRSNRTTNRASVESHLGRLEHRYGTTSAWFGDRHTSGRLATAKGTASATSSVTLSAKDSETRVTVPASGAKMASDDKMRTSATTPAQTTLKTSVTSDQQKGRNTATTKRRQQQGLCSRQSIMRIQSFHSSYRSYLALPSAFSNKQPRRILVNDSRDVICLYMLILHRAKPIFSYGSPCRSSEACLVGETIST
jgi:hypothetical protein